MRASIEIVRSFRLVHGVSATSYPTLEGVRSGAFSTFCVMLELLEHRKYDRCVDHALVQVVSTSAR